MHWRGKSTVVNSTGLKLFRCFDRLSNRLSNRKQKRPLSMSKGEGPVIYYYTNMEEAFAYLAAHAKPGDVCLLSPAASSYDQYKNFEERGGKFKALATHFAETKKDE